MLPDDDEDTPPDWLEPDARFWFEDELPPDDPLVLALPELRDDEDWLLLLLPLLPPFWLFWLFLLKFELLPEP